MELGASSVDTFQLGGEPVDKIMLGTDEVWSDVKYIKRGPEDTALSFFTTGAGFPALTIVGVWHWSSSDDPDTRALIDSGLSFSVPANTYIYLFNDSAETATLSLSGLIYTLFEGQVDCSYLNNTKQCFKNVFLGDVQVFNEASMVDATEMFSGCTSLTCISSLNTLNATTTDMFVSCNALTSPDATEQSCIEAGCEWEGDTICGTTP